MKLSGLRELTINIDVRDVPLRFTLNEAWVKPMLFFARRNSTLQDVKIRVFTPELAQTYVNAWDDKLWSTYQPWYVRLLQERHKNVKELYRLFGQAIAKKIKGLCDECAIEEYREALKERFDGDANMHASNTGFHNSD